MNTAATGAAFQERSNIACLVTTAVIYPAILVIAFLNPTPGTLIGLLIAGVILQVIALAVLHAAAAVFTRAEPDDERVRAITHRSDRLGGLVLAVGVFLVVCLTIAQGLAAPEGFAPGSFASPIITGYVLFAVFVASELARMAHAAVLHRRA